MINVLFLVPSLLILASGCTSMRSSHRQVHQSTRDVWREKPLLTGVVKKIIIKNEVRFIKLTTESEGPTWITILSGSPRVGDAIVVHIDVVKDNFHSKLLNRHFKKLSFGALAHES